MAASKKKAPIVSIIMGSKSDWPTMEIASTTLAEFGVEHGINTSSYLVPK